MARPGILYSDVARAATQLAAAGTNPTVDGVREALGGTGSKSTIAPLLKRWKAERQQTVAAAEAGLPASLLQAVKGLHEHMQSEFTQRFEQAQQTHDAALRAAAEREEALRAEHQALAETRAALSTELDRTQAALAQLQASHHAQSVRLAMIEADNAGLQQRLADRAAEVETLDRQLSQARAQFEHYQEATAAQRAEERQRYEQRIVHLEQDLAGAQRHIAAQQTTLDQQEVKLSHLTTDVTNLRQTLREAQETATEERSARERLTARFEEVVLAKDSLAAHLTATQQQLTDARSTLAAKEREAAMLAEQVRRIEMRIEGLAEEKQAWLQERAVLLEQVSRVASAIPDTTSSVDRSA